MCQCTRFRICVGLGVSALSSGREWVTQTDRYKRIHGCYMCYSVTGTPLAWLQSYLEDRTQLIKLGLHQSPAVKLEVGVPQGSVNGPLLFAVYCSPVGDIITDHGVHYHQYAAPPRHECRQHSCRTLSSCRVYPRRQTVVPKERTAAQPGQVGGSSRRHCESAVCRIDSSTSSVSIAGVDLPVAEDMKVLGVVLDRRLTFHKHVSVVALSYNLLSCAGYQSHQTSSIDGVSTDVSM